MSNSLARSRSFTGDNVPKLTKILFPWSGIFRDACYALVGTFLIQYAITSGVLSSSSADFQLQYMVITIAMMIALLWDGINDPIMGFILEKCHFKAGKFRPWIAIGAIGNSLCVALMFIIPSFFQNWGWGYVVFMIIMYILWDTCFTMNDIGYWSMLPALTNDPKQRASLTTQTAIASTIGTFTINILMFVLQGTFKSVPVVAIYAVTGTVIAATFLVSQLLVFFLCKEKKRDEVQEEVSENSTILDLFKVVAKNKQLLIVAIAMLLYQFSSYIVTGIGQNYFYIVFGYGFFGGGIVATVISMVYVFGTIAAQAFYPILAKRFAKKKILMIAAIVTIISYAAFFIVAFPLPGMAHPLGYNTPDGSYFWCFGGTMFLYYIFAFLFFGATGIFYLGLLVMFQDSIDYNEYHYGERKESICFAWRPLDVKVASGLNRGLQFLTFAITGTSATINAISNWEGISNAMQNGTKSDTLKLAIGALRDARIADNIKGIETWQLTVFGVIIVGTIIALMVGAWLALQFGFKISEEDEAMMVKELAIRNGKQIEKDVAKEAKEEAALEEAK